eukprot:TRINITY_DN5441_c0_g1_i4.p1 TRINITY_DN5441_c0_g1~~TRINITY_DN5441_c0_g1_i4.p1  ORF type:complete len:423 (-),score=33.15 TRINITY_DN5441_c0_g1_i4:31-1299(-)
MRDDMGDPLCRVIWFFSSDELDTRIRPPVVPVPNEVFVGLEWDDNSLGAVLRTVLVLPFKDRERKGNSRFTYFYRYSISSKIFSPCFGIKLNRTAGTLELLENPTEPPMRDALDSLGSILKIKKPLGTTIIKEDVSQEITANSEIVASQLRQASHRESFPTHNTQTLGPTQELDWGSETDTAGSDGVSRSLGTAFGTSSYGGTNDSNFGGNRGYRSFGRNRSDGFGENKSDDRSCFNCGEVGHISYHCPQKKPSRFGESHWGNSGGERGFHRRSLDSNVPFRERSSSRESDCKDVLTKSEEILPPTTLGSISLSVIEDDLNGLFEGLQITVKFGFSLAKLFSMPFFGVGAKFVSIQGGPEVEKYATFLKAKRIAPCIPLKNNKSLYLIPPLPEALNFLNQLKSIPVGVVLIGVVEETFCWLA